MFTIMLAALTAGMATANAYEYGNCINNNSKACQDARNAFAEHHGGMYPQQYQNHAYNNGYYNGGRFSNYGSGERHHWRRHHENHREHHDHN